MLALYRKYRPHYFKDIVGQDEITITIKNQVINNKISHAYLFTGTRGTGKTTMAKVLAKSISCLHPADGEPCGKCEICKASDTLIDVIELDAATNNGVDDIRNLIENAQYPPSRCKYKVYIIDEVHMLSKGAFNALLKTLEEPPKHIVFILATTELNKVPATIRSRCQIYCFNRIKTEVIVKRLQYVCGEEGFIADTDALKLIAINSDGALRDALSILDQVSCINRKITIDLVKKKLGLSDINLILQLSESILNFDITGTLAFYNSIIEKGQSVKQLIGQLLAAFKDIVICIISSNSNNIEGLDEYQEKIKSLSKMTSSNIVSAIINSLYELYNKLSYTLEPVTIVEYELIKICNPLMTQNINSLIERIDILEKQLKDIKKSGKIIEVRKEVKQIKVKDISINLDEALTFNTTINKPKKAENLDVSKNKGLEKQSIEKSIIHETHKVHEKVIEKNDLLNKFDSPITKSIITKSIVNISDNILYIEVPIPFYEVVLNDICKNDIEKNLSKYKIKIKSSY